MTIHKRNLSDMTWLEVKAAVQAGITTVILPLGATEQHGPHLPLGTDSIRITELVKRLAERLPVLVAPTIPVGCSDEHGGFAGLVGVGHRTLAAVIVDCVQRLSWWGIKRAIVLSGHGGNGEAIRLAAEQLAVECPQIRVWVQDDVVSLGEGLLSVGEESGVRPEEAGLHAGEWETSEILFWRPELVREDEMEVGYVGDMEEVLPKLYAQGLRPVTENGVLGDPRKGDKRRGERYVEAQVERLVGVLEVWIEAGVGEENWDVDNAD